MKKFKIIALTLLCVLSLCFLGCKASTTVTNEEDGLGISITLPGEKARAVFYDIDEVVSYTISVSQNGYSVTSKDAAPGETVRIKLTDTGTYDISVNAYDNSNKIIAEGRASVDLVLGDGYKNVNIDIEPYEKTVGINLTAAWETPNAEKYGAEDAVRYDVYIYEGEELVATSENVSLTGNYNVPFYSTYKVKIEAKKANLTVVGSGEASFTIKKGDTRKAVSITIVGEYKQSSSDLGINPSLNWVGGYKREKITFGNWPQSLADVTGITLTATGKVYDGKNAEYSGSDGNKYAKVGDSYYKVEPIIWRVIGYNSDGSKKLLADKIYSRISYYGTTSNRDLSGTTIYANNYKYSNIRAYLNSTKNQFETDGGTPTQYDVDWTNAGFLTAAFTSAELAKIKTVLVDNSAATTAFATNPYACENTEDKVYLLSYKESQKKLYGLNNDSDRIMKTTAYARANGAYQDNNEAYGGYWWLRSPFWYDNSVNEDYYFVLFISYFGNNYYGSGRYVYLDNMGIVPALTVTE